MILPVHAYPLLENALRAANGWTLEEHRGRIGALWSRFSEVAAGNPDAWIRKARTPTEIVTPSVDNRMVSFPYPKLCTANMQVDQGAGYIVCSVEAARAAGVPEERWVFPLAGADAHDHWFLSQRAELHRSPAIRLAGAAALALAGLGIDDVATVDLYSCFPAVVQMAAFELGLAVDDPSRPLTLTGGLTFGGGPGNNYTSHGIARAVGALRAAPGTAALVTGLGWYATKHSLGVYASRPPEVGDGPFAWRDVQPEVDALPECAVDESATGSVRVETYTVAFDREGAPERGIVACRTAADARAWGNITDPDTLAQLCVEEGIGRARSIGRGRCARPRRLSRRALPYGQLYMPKSCSFFEAIRAGLSCSFVARWVGSATHTQANCARSRAWLRCADRSAEERRRGSSRTSMPRVRTVGDTSTALRSGKVPSTWSARCMVTPNQ